MRSPDEIRRELDNTKVLKLRTGDRKPAAEQKQPKLDLSQIPLTPDQWVKRKIESEDLLLGAPFSTTSRGMFAAETGKGKTMICLAIAFAAHLGRSFLHWKPGRSCRVLYIDGEMPRDLMQERIKLACLWFKVEPPEDGLFFLSREDFEAMPPIDSEEWAGWVNTYIDVIRPDFIILDNLMSLTTGNLKETDSWRFIDPWVKSLTRRRIGILLVHHLGHDKTKSYGDSTKEWALDYLILGEAAEDPEANVSLKIEFKKARRRRPESMADFAPGVITLKNGEWSWVTKGTSASSKSQRLSNAAQRAYEALSAAIAQAGEKPPYHEITANVSRAVTMSMWRQYYTQLSGYEKDDKGKDAERKAFMRGWEQLEAAQKVKIWGGWAWPA